MPVCAYTSFIVSQPSRVWVGLTPKLLEIFAIMPSSAEFYEVLMKLREGLTIGFILKSRFDNFNNTYHHINYPTAPAIEIGKR